MKPDATILNILLSNPKIDLKVRDAVDSNFNCSSFFFKWNYIIFNKELLFNMQKKGETQ